MKKLTIAIIFLLPLISKAQLHISTGVEIYTSGNTILYSSESFSNDGKLTIAAGASATLNGGSSSGTGTIKGSSTSNLSIGGIGTSGTYNFDQTTPGTTNLLKDLTLSETSTATLGNALNIVGGAAPGTVIVGSGSTLNTDGFLTLLSNATGTANIGISPGTINGNITAERYIPANGRRYRFLASPLVGGTSLQWRDNAGNTSGRGIQITGTGTVDASTTNQPSAFYYLETNTTGSIHDPAKWIAIDGSTNLTNGKGYRVFVRGDRSISLTTLNTTNNATTIWVNGTYPTGTRTLPVTYTNVTGGGLGWNLVGNPYPCNIDWMSASGWTKTNVGTGVAIWRPSTNSYAYSLTSSDASDNVTVSVNGGGTVIGSGQGFFVRAIGASPALTCTEAVKVTTAPTTLLLKTTPSNQLRIKLTQDTSNIDETIIMFGSKFQDEFLENEDFSKIPNPTVNISSILGKELYTAINFTSNNYTEKTIPLSVWGNNNGTYQLDLTQVAGFDANVSIFLKDKFLNTTTAIDQDKKININLADNSKGDNRFELLFINSATNIEDVLFSNAKLVVYPNPATNLLNVNISNANFKNSSVNIYNVSGQQLINSTMNGANTELNIESLSNGVYFVNVSNEKGFNKTVKFVK
jgi:hypothetical protein